MTLFRNLWGPQYAGVGGQLRKMGELALQPGNYPFIVGAVASVLVIGAVPVTATDRAESKYVNRDAIMAAKLKATGSYH